jgi:hypothetical protein
MENYSKDVLKKELDSLNIFKEGYKNQIKKRSGNELKFVEEQLFSVNNKISEIEKTLKTL